ncbi:glycosyltransferase [Kitasatospora sp. NPDC085895]|uniref:glycosyltransferase family 2 protein n=1 Tax=Kitasatospora sp. NPDC085895 TaxID=3155057 RepID=UPI00344B8544
MTPPLATAALGAATSGPAASTASGAHDGLLDVIAVSNVLVLGYFLAINTAYLMLVVIASGDFVRHLRRTPFAGYDDASASPFTLPVSLIVPAYNEESGIVDAVQALLLLRHPSFEVVVVDDGSTDATLDRLREAFDLVEVPHVVSTEVPVRGAVESVHLPRGGPVPLIVARKRNGGKADALNVGVNLARYPLLCMVDADSILDSQALLAISKPLSDDPLRVVAAGGVIGIANGCTVVAGRVVRVRMPHRLLAKIQTVEYMRAFLLGRTGWSRIGGLLVIAGAFGMFRRDAVVAVGGLDPDCLGEDAELVVRLHHHLRKTGRDYRIVFVGEPISWSEAPETLRVLGRQRRRWHRGLTEVLLKHRGMIGNPRYGRVGLVALPFYVLFELCAPVVELAGLVLVPLGLLIGAVDLGFLWRFLLVAYGYAMAVSLLSLLAEEYAFHRYSRWRDVSSAVLGAAAENLGYRQFTAWWRVRGIWDAVHGAPKVWGVMTHRGFAAEPAEEDRR